MTTMKKIFNEKINDDDDDGEETLDGDKILYNITQQKAQRFSKVTTSLTFFLVFLLHDEENYDHYLHKRMGCCRIQVQVQQR